MKPCPICSRPDAALILQALKKSKKEAIRVSGIPKGTFYDWLKRHAELPPHEVVDLTVIKSSVTVVDPHTASPDVILRSVLTKLLLLGEKAGPVDQVKVTALKASAEIATEMVRRQDRLAEKNEQDDVPPAEGASPPPWLQTQAN